MKLKVPEPLLTQPVETTSGPSQPEGLPLDDKQLDPILEQAVESQPEVKEPEPKPADKPDEPRTAKPTQAAKPLSFIMLALAVAGAVVAITSQGAYGTQPTILRDQPSAAPQPTGGNRGIIWE